jgi:hypothetical protein
VNPLGILPNMNERAQACLQKAAECVQAALRVSDEKTRLMYLDLANGWRNMAEHAETLQRLRGTNGD